VAAAEEAGCSVHRVTEENWLQVTVGLLTRAAARRVAVQCQPGTALTQDRAGAVREALAGKGVSTTDKCDDDTLFSVDAAVTGVIAAIAETGTVICVSGQSSARGVSLIPPVHVALVAGSQLAGDLFDAFGRWHGQLLGCPCWLAGTASLEAGRGTRHPLPANVNLITGPSKTADIEGVLVTGMHGPGAVHVVLLEGE
jgi:L-lactate dehydrogenase complex protein LldG